MIPMLDKAHDIALTDTEKDILGYFEENLNSAVHMNLSELSAALYTSNATIVRFCQKLGLKGYNEFRYQIKNELALQNRKSFKSEDIISHSVALFKDTMFDLDPEKLDRIVELITGDRPVYIYGSYLSSLAARYLQTVLNTLDHPSILIDWRKLLYALMDSIEAGDVLFIITAHGDAEQYLAVFQKARERNVSTVLLTCERDSPLIPYSTVWVCTSDKNMEYRGSDINTRFGIFTVIQLLIEMISLKAFKTQEQNPCPPQQKHQ